MCRIVQALALCATVALVGCASARPTVYNAAGLRTVPTWVIGFSYQPGAIEERERSTGEREVRVTTEGRSASDLQLRDDLFFRLQDRHGIRVIKERASGSGEILLHAVHFRSGGFKSVDVVVNDPTGETLARVRVKNGDRNATFKEDDEFAEYVADAIADLLNRGAAHDERE